MSSSAWLEDAKPARRWWSATIICACALLTATIVWSTGALQPLDDAFTDLQTKFAQTIRSTDVVIVEIDARTLKSLGHWPLPRRDHARLLERIGATRPKAVFFDVDFSTRSTEQDDAALAHSIASLARHSKVVLPSFWQPLTSGQSGLLLSEPLPELREHAELGLVNLVPGSDGLVREVASLSDLTEAVPVWRALTTSTASDVLRLDYRIAPESFRRLSYADVLGGATKGITSDSLVFIGATAIELGDIVAVPVHRALPGIVVQALAYESARDAQLVVWNRSATILLFALWCVGCWFLLAGSGWRPAPFVAIGLLAVAMTGNVAAYVAFDVLLPLGPFIAATIIVFSGALLSSLRLTTLLAWWALRRTHEQDALLSRVVDQSSDAILTLDQQGIVRTANRAAYRILGKTNKALVGRPLAECVPSLAAIVHASNQTEIWLQRDDEPEVAVEISSAQLTWDAQQVTTVTLRDVTAQRTRETELRHLALHDALTGLPNRVALAKQLEASLNARQQHEIVALMMLDLDGFKEVNDALGHSMGDELMRELGRRLAHLATEQRHIARLGGDEFAVLWRVPHVDRIGELAQQLLLLIEEPILIKGVPVSLGTSIGVAMSPDHAEDAESLLKRADVALYVAKRKHTRVEFYEPSDDTNSPRRLEMLTNLRAAVAREELFLEYQPKVSFASGDVIEVEALCRWQSATLGRVVPGEFIPLAEASDLIRPLTEWTIWKALSDCRQWREEGAQLQVAVNLSARHLQDAKLPAWLESTFASTRTRPEWLELEITESAIMTDPDRASKILRALHDLGVKISIDDFGTGYSSLAYLRTLAVDRLKLDRSFITGLNTGTRDEVIVDSTIKLAHGLGLEVVAEGIENEAQYNLLRSFGCDLGQGYWIAKPMGLDSLLQWYRAQHALRAAIASESAPRRATA